MAIYHIAEGETLTMTGPAKIHIGGGEPILSAAEPPTISALNPDTAELGSADIVMTVTGNGFNGATTIVFNGHDEPTTLVSPTEVSTGVKPSLFSVAEALPVHVRNGSVTSSSLDFTFTEAGAAGTRSRRR